MRFRIITGTIAFLMIAACMAMFVPSQASAEPSFFTSNCAGCHSNDSATCNGCHSHGVWRDSARTVKNLKASTDLAQYQPGQTVNVTFSGGYRTGWIRAKLYDQTGKEVARITGPTGMGDDGTGSTKLQFPVLMSAPAPSTPGLYKWSAAWFGSPFDKNNSTVFPHVEEKVSTNQFEVVAPPPVCADSDKDGYQDSACNADPLKGGGDCNDKNPAINPGAPEVAYNGIDDDCSALTPDDDLDGDGYKIAVDCDDTDASVHPGATEICNDGIDNDCDGLVDSADPSCGAPPVDADGDGYTADVDCDDNNPDVHPGATEICDDGIDNDCDGKIDSADPDCTPPPTSEIHLLGPKTGAVLGAAHPPTFTWSPGSDNQFKVEFSYDPAFGSILLRTRKLDVASYTPSVILWGRIQKNKKVYWRVKGGVATDSPATIHVSAETWVFTKFGGMHDDSRSNDWSNSTTIIDMR